MDRLKCDLGKLVMKNPITVASGTFGSGMEFMDFYDVGILGGIMTKGTTIEPRNGNKPQRLVEINGGVINAIGLANNGLDYYIKEILPVVSQYGTAIIPNISGGNYEEYGLMAKKLDVPGVSALEVNISCPNVKEGGIAFGTNPDMAREVTKAVVSNTSKPVIMKLSPNVGNIKEMACAVEDGGAHIISMINTLMGMDIDLRTGKPVISNVHGGYSGPPIMPVALKMVYDVYSAVSVPIIGMGGITSLDDVLKFLMAGASAVSIGTYNFVDPLIGQKLVEELDGYLRDNNIESYGKLIGLSHRKDV